MFVTINGADSGKTKQMDWKRLIQPLGTGTYDLTLLLRVLRSSGYRGPIGLQGYGIKMEPRKLLKQSMDGWRELQAKVKAGEQATAGEIAAMLRMPDLSPSLSTEELRSSFPPPEKTAEEIAPTLSAEAALRISKARSGLGSKLPTVTRVTLYSLLPRAGRITDPKYSGRTEELERLPRFHKYPVLGEVTISDPDEANRWVSFLRDQIRPGGLFLCGFMPRHGFRLSTAKGEVDILMCYHCDQLAAFGVRKIDWKINPVFSWVTKDVVNQLFDKLKIERDQPEEKHEK